MNQHPQPRETPAPILKAAPVSDARKLAETLMDVMSELLGVIERETELVRAGKLTGAMALGPDKAELSRRYVSAVADLKASQEYLAQAAPELLTTLHRHHDLFRAMLQINLTVLATAHAVSESVVRGVNAEVQRQYSQHLHRGGTARGAGPAAHDAARGQPLALTAPGCALWPFANIFPKTCAPFLRGVHRIF
jgi:hypothetical protein